MNDNLSWGKPRLFVRPFGTTVKWSEIATPVEDSTELQPTKGEKVEAKIEGGENEGVRNKKNTYVLVANIRVKPSNILPFPIVDGVVLGEWELMLQPEDTGAIGLHIAKGTISIEDSYKAADGGMWGLNFDALKKDKSTPQVEWGSVNVVETGGVVSRIDFSPMGKGSLITAFGASYKRDGFVTELGKRNASITESSSDTEVLSAITALTSTDLAAFKTAVDPYKVA